MNHGTTAVAQRSAPQLPFLGFRPDVQGMRAVAVIVVLLFHANAPFLPGGYVGVDVFFVISGYLITGLLLREAISNGRISLTDFYARRARRILPAATVVLVATMLLTVAFLPQIRWQQIAVEAAGAAVYVVNWMFAANTDYLNADVAASPLQHFWTLSVEEQFYIVWPLVLIAAVWLTARGVRRWRSARAQPDGTELNTDRLLRFARVGVLAIFVPSLAWSVFYTAVSPTPAYFATTTRLWELALGAVVAVFAPFLARIPHAIGFALGWAGLAGVVVASVTYTGTSPAFPGFSALLPTLGSAAMIVGGMNGRAERGVGWILSLTPMRWLGDISYSLYLWHWPLIVVGTFLLGGTLGFGAGLLIAALSVVPSWLSYRYIETPFRDWPRLKASAVKALKAGGGLVVITTAFAAGVFVAAVAVPTTPPFAGKAEGAVALTTDPHDPDLTSLSSSGEPLDVVEGGFTPSDTEARGDNPDAYEEGCLLDDPETEPKPECVFGDDKSEFTVVLVGDSHAGSLTPAMEKIAEDRDWRLVTRTKAACSFADVPQTHGGQAFPECDEWNDTVREELKIEQPDLVVTVNAGRRGVWENGAPLEEEDRFAAFTDALHSTWKELNDEGIPVVAVVDTPEMGIDVPDCVSANPSSLTNCAVPREEAVEERPHPEREAAAGLPDTEVVDINQWLCPDEYCPAVIGNVLVWRDSHHLTATYAETLAEPLAATLENLSAIPAINAND